MSHLHRQALKLGKLGGCTFLEYERLILFAEEEKLLMGQKDQFLCSPVFLLKICVGYNYFHTSQLFCLILIKAIITLKKLWASNKLFTGA